MPCEKDNLCRVCEVFSGFLLDFNIVIRELSIFAMVQFVIADMHIKLFSYVHLLSFNPCFSGSLLTNILCTALLLFSVQMSCIVNIYSFKYKGLYSNL